MIDDAGTAVIVGTGTVIADNPRLTVRGPDGPVPIQPLRVVIGTRPVSSQAHVLDDEATTLLLATRDLRAAMEQLGRSGIHHALLEGGPTLAGAFLRAGLVDEVVAYLAPALLGAGSSVIGDLGIDTIAEATRLTISEVVLIGRDVRITTTTRARVPEGA